MPVLDHEEYIEQAYLFRVYRERIEENVPAQEVLDGIGDEILATTKLPMAIDFLRSELMQNGRVSDGMTRLSHYFSPFQAFVMQKAEEENSRFDVRVALSILEKEADYRSGETTPQALFIYQFESVARNRLGYSESLQAIAGDAAYDDEWRAWIGRLPGLLGTHDFAELLYRRSEHRVAEHRRRDAESRVRALLRGAVRRAGGSHRQGEHRTRSAVHVRRPAASARLSEGPAPRAA